MRGFKLLIQTADGWFQLTFYSIKINRQIVTV